VDQPEKARDPRFIHHLQSLQPDLIVVAAYGQILPSAILNLPRLGCLNVHTSLLPKYRGAAPIQWAILNGDKATGITIMQMDQGLDTGPVIYRTGIGLDPSETGGTLHDRLADLGATALLECVRRLSRGEALVAQPQPGAGITYARKLDKTEAQIDWTESAEALERRIRAFNPWPVAWCMVGAERIRIWSARLICTDRQEPPGTVLGAGAQGIDIATGKHVLRLLEVQKAGKRRMSAADFLNANSLPGRLDSKP